MPYQLNLFTGVPFVELSAPKTANACTTNKKNAAEEVLRDVLKILENELYHSANARLVAAEAIRLYFEPDKP